MTEWNDGRLDDLSQRIDRIETKMDAGFAHVDVRLEKLEAKFDKKLDGLQRSLIQIAWTFGVGMLTFAGALLGLIAAKL